jgi:hypothetical protein
VEQGTRRVVANLADDDLHVDTSANRLDGDRDGLPCGAFVASLPNPSRFGRSPAAVRREWVTPRAVMANLPSAPDEDGPSLPG